MTTHESASAAGRALYHEVWRIVGERFFDVERLKDWASWEHRFDALIDSEETAKRYIDQMVAVLNDRYSKVLKPVEVVAREEERESTDSVVFSKRFPNNIGYIRILTFSLENIVEQVAAAVAEIADCDAFIVDLRDNSGGLIDNTANCCEFFVTAGAVCTIEWRMPDGRVKKRTCGFVEEAFLNITNVEGEEEVVDGYKRHASVTKGKPVVVLINGGTASSAELMAAAIVESDKESGLAIAIGTQTYGKGIAQGEIDVLGKLRLKLSYARFLSPADVWLGDAGQTVANGVKPDIEVSDDVDTNAPLAAAYEHLKSKLASACTPQAVA